MIALTPSLPAVGTIIGRIDIDIMMWKEKEIKTMGELAEAMKTVTTKEEGQEFMKLARAENPEHADHNIGYITGYFSHQDAERLRDLLDVSHPIFGKKSPTPEEALQAGIEMGRAMKGAKH